jgi:hypothetical protein
MPYIIKTTFALVFKRPSPYKAFSISFECFVLFLLKVKPLKTLLVNPFKYFKSRTFQKLEIFLQKKKKTLKEKILDKLHQVCDISSKMATGPILGVSLQQHEEKNVFLKLSNL